MKLQFTVAESQANERLDSLLVRALPDFSRVKLQRAIHKGDVLVDCQPAKPSFRLKPGQVVTVGELVPQSDAPIPEEIELDILFEDDALVAVNKPPSMVVHPAKGHWSGTLTAALAFRYQSLSSVGGGDSSWYRSSTGS